MKSKIISFYLSKHRNGNMWFQLRMATICYNFRRNKLVLSRYILLLDFIPSHSDFVILDCWSFYLQNIFCNNSLSLIFLQKQWYSDRRWSLSHFLTMELSFGVMHIVFLSYTHSFLKNTYLRKKFKELRNYNPKLHLCLPQK